MVKKFLHQRPHTWRMANIVALNNPSAFSERSGPIPRDFLALLQENTFRPLWRLASAAHSSMRKRRK